MVCVNKSLYLNMIKKLLGSPYLVIFYQVQLDKYKAKSLNVFNILNYVEPCNYKNKLTS